MTAQQLEQLVAPIALYPDNLVAQILAAATYPAQVAAADQWLQGLRGQGYMSPEQIAAGANAQDWDPSVKALTAFPQVLAQMDQALQWTTDLGNAYYNQPQDVMQTIQILRQRAQAAGNLQSTSQEQVTDNQGYIQVEPVNPQVVYVPMYNPWYVYGQPIAAYPGYSLLGAIGAFVGGAVVRFGPGIALGAFAATPFGWGFWALNWLGHSVFFNHAAYYSHSTTVARWGYGRGGYNAYGHGNSYGRGAYSGYRNSSEFRQSPGNLRSQYGQQPGYGRSGNEYRNQNYARGESYQGNRGYGEYRQYDSNRAFAANRVYNGNRAYMSPQGNYGRPAVQDNHAYDHPQPQAALPNRGQSIIRPESNSFYGNRPQAYTSRHSYAYSAPQRNEFSQRSYSPIGGSAYSGRGFSEAKQERSSGGSHMFGGGHSEGSIHGGGHAPKSSGGGHFGGGGHSGGGHSGHHH